METFSVSINNNRQLNFNMKADNIDEAIDILNDFMEQFDIFKFAEEDTIETTDIDISECKKDIELEFEHTSLNKKE